MLVSSLRRSVALGLGALVLAVIAVLASGCLQPATKPGSPAGPPNESVLSGNEPFRSDYTVGELAEACGLPTAMASEHLRLMQRCGFLTSDREGRKVFYRVIEPHLENIMGCVEARFDPSVARR